MSAATFIQADARQLPFDDDSFDLVFGSPPYESRRAYAELGFDLAGEAWVEWASCCFMECLRVSRGLVAWVVEGSTEDFRYSSAPFLLMADLHRAGVMLRKPAVYKRHGIPGSGGPDWLRNDWEPIICATKAGRLPWAEPTAMGEPPRHDRGETAFTNTRRSTDSRARSAYVDPEVCNPGNVISGLVGHGHMGWVDACRVNEAPFPEWLATFFVRTFCPPGGTVLDPFSGSGTTAAAAVKAGRNAVGVDIRESQIEAGRVRVMGLSMNEHEQGQQTLFGQTAVHAGDAAVVSSRRRVS